MRISRSTLLLVLALAAPLSAAPAAHADTAVQAGLVDGVLAVANHPGQAAHTTIYRRGANFFVYDQNGVVPASGCTHNAGTIKIVHCSASGITSVQFTGRTNTRDFVTSKAGLGVRAVLDGGDGSDTLTGLGASDIWGGAGDDVLRGGAGGDRIYGQGGHDWIRGGAGGDRLDGGTHNDTLIGNDGADLFIGGPNNDWLFAADDLCSTTAALGDRLFGGTYFDHGRTDVSDTATSVEDLVEVNTSGCGG